MRQSRVTQRQKDTVESAASFFPQWWQCNRKREAEEACVHFCCLRYSQLPTDANWSVQVYAAHDSPPTRCLRYPREATCSSRCGWLNTMYCVLFWKSCAANPVRGALCEWMRRVVIRKCHRHLLADHWHCTAVQIFHGRAVRWHFLAFWKHHPCSPYWRNNCQPDNSNSTCGTDPKRYKISTPYQMNATAIFKAEIEQTWGLLSLDLDSSSLGSHW